MEAYRKKLKTRIICLSCFSAVAVFIVVICAVIAFRLNPNEHINSRALGFQCGFFTAGGFMLVRAIVIYARALKSTDKSKKLYIEEHDERSITINLKAGQMGYFCSLCVLVVALIVSGFFNEVIFLTLAVVVFTISVIGAVCKLVYHKIL